MVTGSYFSRPAAGSPLAGWLVRPHRAGWAFA